MKADPEGRVMGDYTPVGGGGRDNLHRKGQGCPNLDGQIWSIDPLEARKVRPL